MRVSIQENNVKPGSYRVVLHTGQRASFEDFIRHVEGGSTITRADAVAVLTAAREWIALRAFEGREADLGPLGRSRLGMKGTFDALPERIQDQEVTLTLGWVLPPSLKRKVARQGAKLVRERVEPEPKRPNLAEARGILPSGTPDPVPGRYAPGGAVRLSGFRLDFDAGLSDEGIFLVADGGTEQRVEQVVIAAPSSAVFMMPPTATSPFIVVVRRRHLSGPLLEGRLDKPIVPA